MRGNNYYQRKDLIEDEIIEKIDMPRRVKSQRPIEILLRVPIIELLTYKAAMSGRALKLGMVSSFSPNS